MKALTFLEAMDSIYQKWDGMLFTSKELRPYYKYYLEFYSQEFKPEMITELFEGWEERRWAGGGTLYEVNRVFRIYKHKGKEIMHYEIMNDNNTLWISQTVSIFPHTLDDFINECNKRKIGLRWKQEIIDKCFK